VTIFRQGKVVTASEARLEDERFGAGISQLHVEAEIATENAYRHRVDEDTSEQLSNTDMGRSTIIGDKTRGNKMINPGVTVIEGDVMTGYVQPLLKTADFELDKEALVGPDSRVYTTRQGLIECLAPVTLPPDSLGKVYVETIDWAKFPPLVQLAYLFREFFSKYDREVLMIVGYKRDGSGWRYHVPRQVGSFCLVEWSADDEEMDDFSRECQWVGTIHIHPGCSCVPSKTDIDDWAKPEKAGLHIIFGRDGSYTIQGAIAGQVFELEADTLDLTTLMKCEWTTSGGRPLQELLLVPAPAKAIATTNRGKHRPSWARTKWKEGSDIPNDISSLDEVACSNLLGEDILGTALDCAGAWMCSLSELRNLQVVIHKGHLHLLTPDAAEELKSWCRGENVTPKLRHILVKLAKPSSMDAKDGRAL